MKAAQKPVNKALRKPPRSYSAGGKREGGRVEGGGGGGGGAGAGVSQSVTESNQTAAAHVVGGLAVAGLSRVTPPAG